MIREVLARNHEVTLLESGQQALDQFEPGRFDIAIIDLGLPGDPGDRVAAMLKASDPILVTVLMTGWKIQTDDPRRSVFDFHLEKPFQGTEEIEQTVSQALQLHDKRYYRRG